MPLIFQHDANYKIQLKGGWRMTRILTLVSARWRRAEGLSCHALYLNITKCESRCNNSDNKLRDSTFDNLTCVLSATLNELFR